MKLYGALKDRAPEVEDVDFDVQNVKQCVEAFSTQCDFFVRNRPLVQIKEVKNEHDLLRTDVEVLHVFPAFVGGKSGGFTRILIGAALIALAFSSPAFFTAAGSFTTLGSITFNVGVSLVLSGVAQLMAPKPQSAQTGLSNVEGSKYLPTSGNTVKIGTRIPLGYGRQKVFGHILSFNVTSNRLNDQSLYEASGPLQLPQYYILRLGQGYNYGNPYDGNDVPFVLSEARGGTGMGYTYSVSGLPNRWTFSPTTRELNWTGNPGQFTYGGFVFTYTVEDSGGDMYSVRVPIKYDFSAPTGPG